MVKGSNSILLQSGQKGIKRMAVKEGGVNICISSVFSRNVD